MARKSYKMEQQSAQRIPIIGVGAEQDHIDQPVSSGDTIALDTDFAMTDGNQTIHENKKTGKSWSLKLSHSATSHGFCRQCRGLQGRSPK